MTEGPFAAGMVMTLHFLIQIALKVQVLLRSYREPALRIAWVVVILCPASIGTLCEDP
jgi:hypothetical protein